MEWFKVHGRDLPWRRTHDPYAVLVSEFMLQQTQVATVIDYYHRWLERFPTVEALADADEADVLRAWEGLGYYARARNLHAAARLHPRRTRRGVPARTGKIAALPGVGRYTAGAVASFAFDLSAPIVEANTARVLARLIHLRIPIDTAPGQRALWAAAEELTPATENARLYNSALMELGATVCRARAPQCLLCPVLSLLRRRPARPRTTADQKSAQGDHRADGGLRVDRPRGTTAAAARSRLALERPVEAPAAAEPPPFGEEPLMHLAYPFTHYQVTLRIYPAPAPLVAGANQAWCPLENLETVAMAAPAPARGAATQQMTFTGNRRLSSASNR